MDPVSRETSSPLSLQELLIRLGRSIEESFCFPSNSLPSFVNVHSSLVPFLLLWLSHLKSFRCVVSVEGFRDRQRLFEELSIIEPGSAFNVSRSSASELSGADLHNINSFSAGVGSFLLVSPEIVDNIGSIIQRGGSEPLRLCSIKTRSQLISLFNEWGLDVVRQVDSPGTYAVRGSIIDCFLLGSSVPLRLEFYGEKLVTVRSFDLSTQKMVEVLDFEKVEVVPPLKIFEGGGGKNMSEQFALAIFSLVPVGPSKIYDLAPLLHSFNQPFDLACVTHPSFINNPVVLKPLIKKFEASSFGCLLFCGKAHNVVVDKNPSLDPFLITNLPFGASFSSGVLGVFWVSLYSIFAIKQKPVLSSVPNKKDVPSDHLLVFPWKKPVVHENLGVGLYLGLSTVSKDGVLRECVALEFKRGDLVHVPLDSLGLISNYISNDDNVVLTDLRSSRWSKTKKGVLKAAGEMLDRFVEIYGDREEVEGFSFSSDGIDMDGLVESFPYSETEDQIRCLEEVQKDMKSKKPMDRLICGDVGVGKTEVAIRATYRALVAGKQVLVLAPTTILANQLFNSFSKRLALLGVEVKQFSRLTESKEVKNILHSLASGKVCVVVGTHRLLSKAVSVPNLGLVVIDEEHRFGAKQKEFLRDFCLGADVLSMSATPIPRTLQFSLSGIRDISTIKTPPPGRLPIITSVEEFQPEFLKSAILYEVGRGGQIFFVNSNISEIPELKRGLHQLLPDLKIGLAHGRLKPEELEGVMLKMVNGEFDLLLSTTIIEAGIDLPNVNTIFINNAHLYGLAQLYQMRGRVGRSSVQAYCYLVLPQSDIGVNARERLRTIQYNSELGSGFAVAMRDLEMRGGGNLFGVEQSGHLAAVGLHLYTKIVREAAAIRGGASKNTSLLSEKKVGVSVVGDALIPSEYIEEQDDRLYFYQLLSSADKVEKVVLIEEEMCDRFGPPPKEVMGLLSIKRIRLSCVGFSVESIEVSEQGAVILFSKDCNLVDSIGKVLGSVSTIGLPYSVINKSGGNGGLFLSLNSIVDCLFTLEYTFESSRSSG